MRATRTERFVALDLLRGLAVAGMILVVSPGDWSHVFPQLRHAAWNGATLADMVFPTFLFSVGAALGLSFPRRLEGAEARRFWTLLLRRAAVLVVLGLFVEATYVWAIWAGAPYPGGPGLAHLRLPGILQRIGLCYAAAGALLAATARRGPDGRSALDPLRVAAAGAAILIGYALLITFTPVPGHGAGRLTPDGSLPGFVDRALFTEPHLWPLGSATGARPATYDPEGLLASLPATVNVLLGALAAWVWRRDLDAAPWRIALAGAAAVAAGLALDPVLVINKRLWTSSFALLAGGVSALVLAALMAALRLPRAEALLKPFQVLGGNAILAFLLSTLFSRVAGFALVPDGGGRRVDPQTWGFHLASAIAPDPQVASLLCALGVLGLVTLMLWPLHRRAIHFRI